MKRNTLVLLAVTAAALAGCSASTRQSQSSCELKTAQICSSAAEAQLSDGTLMVGYSSQPGEGQVVPYVAPVFRQDGTLAAEVDCYANTDSHIYSIVRSYLAIPPESQDSIHFLRDRHLCADEELYAEDGHPRVGVSTRTMASR